MHLNLLKSADKYDDLIKLRGDFYDNRPRYLPTPDGTEPCKGSETKADRDLDGNCGSPLSGSDGPE